MGGCVSKCRNRNSNEEDIKINPEYPKSDISGVNLSYGSIRRTKKNKTRMPKDIQFNEEEEKILNQYRRNNSILCFDQHSDTEDKKNNNNEEKEKEKIIEIINTDLPNKEEIKDDDDNKDENDKIKDKLEIDNINNEFSNWMLSAKW